MRRSPTAHATIISTRVTSLNAISLHRIHTSGSIHCISRVLKKRMLLKGWIHRGQPMREPSPLWICKNEVRMRNFGRDRPRIYGVPIITLYRCY
ncbi:hypothetical protein B0J17DRAFT_230376 [Rhizoctonia solani]|nr:hypothetical protein B0J17DRAFT_230376 [Rhizoctonia solani]